MYKLASEKKAARTHLVIILEDGLFAATAAYIFAKKSRDSKNMEIFQKEAENFAKAGSKLQKIINGGYLDKEWAQRSEDCKKWLDTQASRKVFLRWYHTYCI